VPLARLVRTGVAVGVLLVPIAALAQGRVGVRPVPKPGEVIHVTARQDLLLRFGGNPEEPAPPYLELNNALTFTQTNGTFGGDGKLNAQIVIDTLVLNESLGGMPRQGPDTSGVKGRLLVVTLDRTGKLLGIKVPPDLRDVSSRLTQILAGAFGMINFLPAVELAVGEETINATELPMRLPGNVSQGPLEARTTLKLRAVDRQGGSRIARLEQAIDVATATTTIQITGGGTADVNLDRGFVSGAQTEWKMSGTMPQKNGTPGPPFFGSFKISVNAE
jgi:hypothetical protein